MGFKIFQPDVPEKENIKNKYLQEMFRSLSIQIEKDVLADYLVADNAENKEYCNVIVAKIDKLLEKKEI